MSKSKQVLELATLNLGHRRAVTPNQSRINQNFAAVGQAWDTLALPDRAAWQNLANQMPHQTGLRTADGLKQTRTLSAYQCFASLNATLLACGQDILTDAPDTPSKPAPLPPVLLTAQANVGDAIGVSPFTLTLTVPNYTETFQVYASAPLLAGQYPVGNGEIIIATLPGGGSSPIDLTDAYMSKFGVLSPGQQVTLTLVPVSAQGFKGNPLALAADVAAPRATAAHQGDQNRALKAA